MADERPRPQSPESPTSDIGGWLVLLAFGLLTGPFLTGFSIWCNFSLFGTSMPAGLQSALMMETLALSGMLLFQIYVAIAFFRRRTTAPNLVIALLVARVLFEILDLMAVEALARESPGLRGLTGSLIAAAIWIPYLLLSQRVKATFVFGDAIGNGVAGTFAGHTGRELAFVAPTAARHPESDHGTGHLDSRLERDPSENERIVAMRVGGTASASSVEWRAIRDGREIGPVSPAELAEMAGTGEIDADDLVKNHTGLWTKAREFGFLQQQFVLRDSREEARRQALKRRDRFHGIWLSKNALAIGCCVLLAFFLGLATMVLTFNRPTKSPIALEPAAKAPAKGAAFYSNRGFASWSKRDYENAIKDFTEAIRLDPKDAESFRGRGYVWSEKKEYDKAIEDYSEAIRLDPKDAGLFRDRGFAWSDKKEYDKAIEDYSEAIRLNPNDDVAYRNRGRAWSGKYEYDKAIRDFTEAILRNPNDGLNYACHGSAWRHKNHFQNAQRDFEEANRLDPVLFPQK